MEVYQIVILVVGIVLFLGLITGIILTMYIANQVFNGTLVRVNKDTWARTCPFPENEENAKMWEIGLTWGKENQEFKKEVSIFNKTLKLCGEFFDFGNKKTVIIAHGRTDNLWYSYYYAKPYRECGYNVLVIDARAHGNSEGKYNSCGIKESDDLIAWMEYLHNELNQEEIICHGICVGGAASVLAGCKDNTPDYYKAVIVDGLFSSFKDIYADHFKESGHKLFPVFYEVWILFYLKNKVSIKKSYPNRYVHKLKPKILYLYSREDKYSRAKKSMDLYNSTKSEKQIHWFDKGVHSHVRYHNEEEYDKTIIDFIK